MRKAIRGCTPSSSGCDHLLEGVPYCSSLMSSSRLQEVVAVVLFLQGLVHWMELFWTALVTQLISLSFFHTSNLTSALHEREIGQLFLGENKLLPFPVAPRKAFRKTGFALRAFHDENLHVCDACLRFLPDRTPRRGGVS